jgi:hypothetical protein
MMTVAELIEVLQYMDQDAEVRLAQQPNYPFEYSVDNVVQIEAPAEDEDGEDEDAEQIVYISDGSQLDYLPGVVSRELGWK